MANISEELARLAKLRDDGVLTASEFEIEKAKILNGAGVPESKKSGHIVRNGALGCGALIILLVIIGAVVGGGATGNSTAPVNEQAKTPTAIKVTAREVAKAYNQNEARAQQSYGDKLLDVSGKIEGVSLDLMNKPFLQLDTGELIPANASLDEASQAKASSLSKGAKIELLCKGVQEVISIPQFQECAIH